MCFGLVATSQLAPYDSNIQTHYEMSNRKSKLATDKFVIAV